MKSENKFLKMEQKYYTDIDQYRKIAQQTDREVARKQKKIDTLDEELREAKRTAIQTREDMERLRQKIGRVQK